MSGPLDKTEIEVPCENCKRRTKKTIAWIKSNSNFRCGCGTTVKIDASQFKREIAKVEAALRSLGG